MTLLLAALFVLSGLALWSLWRDEQRITAAEVEAAVLAPYFAMLERERAESAARERLDRAFTEQVRAWTMENERRIFEGDRPTGRTAEDEAAYRRFMADLRTVERRHFGVPYVHPFPLGIIGTTTV